ncbi:MAG: hypothetical protein ACE5GQ_07350, partial [Nitrospinales bacterium]
MSESAPPQHTNGDEKSCCVILFLPPPPPSAVKTAEWYWHEIAGAPFLLRNILNVQRGKAERLILYSDKNDETDELRRRVGADPRVRLKLDWVSGPQQLAQAAGGYGSVLALDGSALYNKTEIRAALAMASSGEEKESCPGLTQEAGVLDSFLEQFDGLTRPWLEQARGASAVSSG